jgi:hypothetical protein
VEASVIVPSRRPASDALVTTGLPARAVAGAVVRIGDRAFELAVALTLALVGVAWAPDVGESPLHSPVAVRMLPWQDVWSGMYVLGAVFVFVGIPRRRCHWRVAGLVLLTTGLLLEGIAATSFAVSLRAAVYFIFATACAGRALALVLGHLRRKA